MSGYTVRGLPYLLGTEFPDGQVRTLSAQFIRDAVGTLATRTINVLDYLTAGQPDGTTDNTAQLQAAVNAAAGKAVVYFPTTTNNYNLLCVNTVLDGVNGRAALLIPSNSHLIIDGTLFLQSNSPGGNISGMLYTNGTSNIVIEGHGTLNGNAVGQIAGNLGHQCCIRTANGSNILIRDLTLLNSSGSNFTSAGTTNILIENITQSGAVFASQFTGLQGSASSNCWIRNSNLSCTTDFAWAFYDGVSAGGIVGCTINATLGILSDGGSLYNNNILVDGNIFNVPGAAVQVYSATVTGFHTYINISNNQIITSRTVGNSPVSITYASHVSVTDNIIDATAATHAGVAGIYVDNGSTNYVISGNVIRNQLNGIGLYTASNGIVVDNIISNSNNNGAAGAGIVIHHTCANTIISRNRIFDDQGSPTQNTGIMDDGTSPGSGAVITDNIISNTSTASYTIHPLSDTILVKYGDTVGVIDFGATTLRTAAIGAYAEVTLANIQNPAANTSTKIAFDTVIYDTASGWDVVTNHRYTAPIAGKYFVVVSVVLVATTATAGNPWKASIYRNGTEIAHSTWTAPNANSQVNTQTCSYIVAMNGSSDYVEGWGTCAGTVGMAFNPTAGGVAVTYMTIQYIGT